MKAVLCKKWGTPEDLIIEDVKSPKIKANEVLIEVKAVGLNFPDILLVAGKYQAKPPFPFIPGGEVSGTIKAVGKSVKHLQKGMRVAALCQIGGMAEQLAVNAAQVLPIPDEMDFETAAAFMVVYGTSHVGLLHRAKLKKEETLLVHGAAGGVGLAAIEIAKKIGAKVIATASTEEKLAVAKEKGADFLINYQEKDFVLKVKEITNNKGCDVIYDPVGGDVADKSLKVIAWEGRHLVIGFAQGRIQEVPANILLLKNASLVGLFWGKYADRNPPVLINSLIKMIKWFEEGIIKPHVYKTFALEEYVEALNTIAQRKVIGKVVVKVN